MPDLAFGHILQHLKRLRRLSYDVLANTEFPVEELFPLFSRLDELVVPSRAWVKGRPEKQDEIESALSPTSGDPWKLKKLDIARGNLPLLQHCSDRTLRELLVRREYMISNPFETSESYLPILRFTHLDSIRLAIESSPGQEEDVALVLSSLKQARELVLDVFAIQDLDFLNSPPITVALARQQPLVPERSTFRQLLMTRPRLKTFVVTNHDVDPDILFEQSGVRAGRGGWVCEDLETLSLCFPKGIYSKTLFGRNSTWQSIYGQIGKLTKLKSLSLRCVGLQRNVEAGFKQLAGATCLQELTMIDVRFLKWTEEEVELLLPLVPKLTTLSFGPLQDIDFLSVSAWLIDHGRSEVRLVRE
ncbi:hypothetical protein BGZ96_004629 [Linnemannia gamsii]|uniref:Uncharacterized protein n=1 Tax=Linnemannia gamsii TaxID=64522 RepID=A0ABQ7K654_9FUNG|nr:hypothetical protein BGZ96_004629 [Linnemannia gamsii]